MSLADYYRAGYIGGSGGGGGSLPAPTAADDGKAVVVSAQPTEGAVIVPEQTGEIVNESFVCDDAVVSLFIEGAQVLAYENGKRYECTIEDAGGGLGFNLDETQDSGFYLHEGSVVFFDVTKDEGEEVTVKLAVRGADSVEYGFGGGTLLVHASNFIEPPESGTVYTFPSDTVIDKSYNEIKNALLAGRTVTLVASMSVGDDEYIYTLALVSLTSFDGEYNVTFTAYDSAEIQYYGFFTSYDPDGTMTG